MKSLPGFDSNEMLDGLREWVEIESPTDTPEAVNRMMDRVEQEFTALGCQAVRIPGKGGFGDCMRVTAPWNGNGKGILVLCHLDTVHPMGTIERLPFKVDGDLAYGPGIFDMKGGAYIGYYALKKLIEAGKQAKLPVTFFFNSDEEMSSKVSREYIKQEAQGAKYTLVLEPARDNGEIVDSRKGTARFHVTVHGKPSHAGSKHEEGRSAIKELARQILKIEELTDYERKVTVNVGVITGGTRPNVISEFAEADVDMRVPSKALADEMIPQVMNLTPFDPDVTITVTGGAERPPFEKTPGGMDLLEKTRVLAKELGVDELGTETTGGASDANFANPIAPALDGLGVMGKGAHTLDEHIKISSLAPRASLFYRLLETLD